MRCKALKKAIFLALLAGTLSYTNVYAAESTNNANAMQLIYEQSAYNPHLQDAVVADDESIVKIESGSIRGSVHDGVYQYLGVPYAEATERFVKAEKVAPWDGIKDMTAYGPQCPQYIFGTKQPLTDVPTSNNAQNLNIWTTSLDKKAKKPVMVWLHGGGFSSGSANEAQYDGENLSRKGDVVIVGVNHRLNALGHLDLSAYGEKYKDSANAGGTDLVAALHWIHDNIQQFGGDPKNVTVFGESGGGSKVFALMSAPSAKGFFQKGIIESGAVERNGAFFNSSAMSQEIAAETLKNLNLAAENVEELQTMPIEKIWQASDKALQTVGEKYKIPNTIGSGYVAFWEPVTGTEFLPDEPVSDKGFAPSGKDVALMIGSNLTEWSTILPSAAHKDMTQEQKNMFAKAYPNEDIGVAPYVDTILRPSLLKVMAYKADQGGAPVYAYVFTKQIGNAGVYHTAEIPYIFNNLKEQSPLADTMTKLWSSFAWTGRPAADGVPAWKPYTRQNGNTMILDDKSELVQHHDEELLHSLMPGWQY